MSFHLLGNYRWLTLVSDQLGRDWIEKSLQIDQQIEKWGLDLADESIAIIFLSSPSEIRQGRGRCEIGRPVIGPKRSDSALFKLEDWGARKCQIYNLNQINWSDVAFEVERIWESLKESEANLKDNFVILLKRTFKPELTHFVEVLFWVE